MVVQIKGPVGSKEYKYGRLLKQLFETDPQLRTEQNRIDIIVSVQCYGQNVQDVDIVVFGKFENYYANVSCEVESQNVKPQLMQVLIHDFCTVIEIKAHDMGNISFEGSEIIVNYNGKPHPALQQNRNQMFSLKNYLHLNGKMNVTNFVFLPNVLSKHLPESIKNSPVKYHLILSDSTLEQFWQSLLEQPNSKSVLTRENGAYRSTIAKNTSADYIENIVTKLTQKISASRLDREKMERICKTYLKDQNYVEKLGQQLLIYRGKGGTGKTYHLLNVAHNLYEGEGARILILTYNNALVADIKRLFALLHISDGVEESIQIRTWHSYLGKFYYVTGIVSADVGKSKIDSAEYKEKFQKYLLQESAKQKLETLKPIDRSELLYWDYVMVDEAQDWKPLERDILYRLFGFKKIIIAHGVNQLIRSPVSCDWRYHPHIKKFSQLVQFKKSLRQKPNLSRFITVFSEETGLDWDIKVNDELYGGKVIVFIGKYDLNIHAELIEQNRLDKNENIDMLFCVPPKDIKNGSSSFVKMLEEQGYLVWDGTSEYVRNSSYPQNLDEFRIVQYDSSRGLEGWISVNIAFDSFYEYKLKSYREENGQQTFLSVEENRKNFAGNWLQIPLTRAMDTLVINIENRKSPLYTILKKIYEDNQEYIEWRESVV